MPTWSRTGPAGCRSTGVEAPSESGEDMASTHSVQVLTSQSGSGQRQMRLDHTTTTVVRLVPTHEALEVAALLVGEPPHPDAFSHPSSVATTAPPQVDPDVPVWSGH